MELNYITGQIVNAAFAVHSSLGPGLLENVYSSCLKLELEGLGLKVQKEVPMPLHYKTYFTEIGYRLDLLVESEVVVELKSVDRLTSIHQAQLLTYLKLSRKKLGLLINFNAPLLKNGIIRLANQGTNHRGIEELQGNQLKLLVRQWRRVEKTYPSLCLSVPLCLCGLFPFPQKKAALKQQCFKAAL